MKNPLQFPSYTQEFTVTFADEKSAERATAGVAPLPFGKKVAFTTRWDDSNPRHLKQAQTLHAHGMKGTFLLNALSYDFRKSIVEELKILDSTLGNHGLGHPMFFNHTPNAIFERVVLFQAELESQINAPIVSFTFPCGRAGGRGDLFPGGSSQWGDWLARGGIYSYPESKPDMAVFLNRGPDCCFGSYLFSANDSAPDETMFRDGFARCYKSALNDPDIPRVTLGVHTWQSDVGFAVLDKLYAEYANRPEIWYCNENEYAAYRYNFYHAEIEKISVNGNQATFRITRFEPAFAGHTSDLCINFSEGAESIVLPDLPEHAMPALIDRAENGSVSRKFPGISAELRLLPNNRFRIVLHNESREALSKIVSSLILPPKWKNGLHRIEIPDLAAGGFFETIVDPGETLTDSLYETDRIGFDLRLDFVQNEKRGRIHFIKLEPYRRKYEAVPRDCVQIVGPFAAGTIPEEQIASLSYCGVPLAPLGEAANLRWCKTDSAGSMPYSFVPCAAVWSPAYEKALNSDKCTTPDTGNIVFALEFEGGTTKIALDTKFTVCFWIDGVRYEQKEQTTVVPLVNGRHRIVVLGRSQHAWAFSPNRSCFGVYDTDSGEMQKCFEIKEFSGMKEEEKIFRRELFCPGDPELKAIKMRSHKLSRQYSELDEDDTETRNAILQLILGAQGEGNFFQGPVFFHYGKHTSIGSHNFFNYNTTVQDDAPVWIGNDNNFGPNFTVVTPQHPLLPDERRWMLNEKGETKHLCYAQSVKIGNDCWFGADVTVCPGVTIGDNCVIGAGSVVTHDIPSNSVAAGGPCRVIRELSEADSMENKLEIIGSNKVMEK